MGQVRKTWHARLAHGVVDTHNCPTGGLPAFDVEMVNGSVPVPQLSCATHKFDEQ